ncbi:nucleoid-associated protein [Methylobacterium sp. J-001]|uniref:nucleoid-associated protein n=1 Tax=Methylobacterium sp. J-001 TaxID=2836609 RepID=UPI001FBA18BB|nr:nucleoid-associated protein [Methylobacterium sp. J-001]MCJ2119997.1 nucleoid-associated protein [Methylobacterium sp. J-001]
MPVLTDEEKATLRVEHFIFHSVHHGKPDPTLRNRVHIGKFEPFFVARVIDTLKGNRFVFDTASPTLAALRGAEEDPTTFVEMSKELARQFHREDDQTKHDGRFKRGILMVAILRAGDRRFHSLIKFDHGGQVIDIVEEDADATLAEVLNPLTENKKALQKSALIELDADGGRLVVIDHSKRSGITDFFQEFLGAQRAKEAPELTDAVVRGVLATVRAHATELPPQVCAQWRERLTDIALRRQEFDADQVFSDLFGAGGTEAVRSTWDAQLAANDVEGEGFSFDHGSLPSTGPRKYRTAENIEITVPPGAKDTFVWDEQDDGSVIVTIRTSSLVAR